MTDEPIPEPDLFDCGCFVTFQINDGVREAVVSRCCADCETYKAIISQGRAAGLPIEFRPG